MKQLKGKQTIFDLDIYMTITFPLHPFRPVSRVLPGDEAVELSCGEGLTELPPTNLQRENTMSEISCCCLNKLP